MSLLKHLTLFILSIAFLSSCSSVKTKSDGIYKSYKYQPSLTRAENILRASNVSNYGIHIAYIYKKSPYAFRFKNPGRFSNDLHLKDAINNAFPKIRNSALQRYKPFTLGKNKDWLGLPSYGDLNETVKIIYWLPESYAENEARANKALNLIWKQAIIAQLSAEGILECGSNIRNVQNQVNIFLNGTEETCYVKEAIEEKDFNVVKARPARFLNLKEKNYWLGSLEGDASELTNKKCVNSASGEYEQYLETKNKNLLFDCLPSPSEMIYRLISSRPMFNYIYYKGVVINAKSKDVYPIVKTVSR